MIKNLKLWIMFFLTFISYYIKIYHIQYHLYFFDTFWFIDLLILINQLLVFFHHIQYLILLWYALFINFKSVLIFSQYFYFQLKIYWTKMFFNLTNMIIIIFQSFYFNFNFACFQTDFVLLKPVLYIKRFIWYLYLFSFFLVIIFYIWVHVMVSKQQIRSIFLY